MHKTVFGLIAIGLMALMVASVMESSPSGAHAKRAAVAAPEMVSAFELMARATNLPVTLTSDAF
jgi:hypothetical protein